MSKNRERLEQRKEALSGWICVTERMPSVYLSGTWDGEKSDQVLAEGESGGRYLATYYEGFLDGSEFKDWYASNDFEITEPIVKFLEIPD